MKLSILTILSGLFFMSGGSAAAATHPVLRLYQERLELARLELQKVDRMKAYVEDRQRTLEKAYTSGSIPERSILEINRQVGQSKSLQKLLRSQVKQAEALLVVAERMIGNGQEMPFCLKE